MHPRHSSTARLLSCALVALTTLACREERERAVAKLQGDAAHGATVYDQTCWTCHQARLTFDCARSRDLLIKAAVYGRYHMPPQDELSEQDIADVVAFATDCTSVEKLTEDFALNDGPGFAAVETREGPVFVSPTTGGTLRRSTGEGTWTHVTPAVSRFFADFRGTDTFAENVEGGPLLVARGGQFVPTAPAVLPPGHASIPADAGFLGLRGRDSMGVWWATASLSDRQLVFHLEADAGVWLVDEVPLVDSSQSDAAAHAVMTSDARFFFRPERSGVWEAQLASHTVVERVPCSHQLFRASNSSSAPCDENVTLLAGPNGALFIYTSTDELWRLGQTGFPMLAAPGVLPSLATTTPDGHEQHRTHAASLTVDPTGRVWLAFGWGANEFNDLTYLYRADPEAAHGWSFVSKSLPGNLLLFGDTAPLLVSQAQERGFLVYRAILP